MDSCMEKTAREHLSASRDDEIPFGPAQGGLPRVARQNDIQVNAASKVICTPTSCDLLQIVRGWL